MHARRPHLDRLRGQASRPVGLQARLGLKPTHSPGENKLIRTINLLVFCTLWIGFSSTARANQIYELQVQRDVPAKMRDGVVLRADVYRPKAEGRFPVILVRTPYDKKAYGVDFGLRAA